MNYYDTDIEFEEVEEDYAPMADTEELTDLDYADFYTDFESEELNDATDTELAPEEYISEIDISDSWRDIIKERNPDISDATLDAWETPTSQRTPRQVELVDEITHPEFEAQKTFKIDENTGKAMRDADGNWVEDIYGNRGSQRPDLFMEDELGIHMREDKIYNDAGNLINNIRSQTALRREGFGDDVDITYVLAPNFSVEDADRIQNYCENILGVNIEWQL